MFDVGWHLATSCMSVTEDILTEDYFSESMRAADISLSLLFSLINLLSSLLLLPHAKISLAFRVEQLSWWRQVSKSGPTFHQASDRLSAPLTTLTPSPTYSSPCMSISAGCLGTTPPLSGRQIQQLDRHGSEPMVQQCR